MAPNAAPAFRCCCAPYDERCHAALCRAATRRATIFYHASIAAQAAPKAKATSRCLFVDFHQMPTPHARPGRVCALTRRPLRHRCPVSPRRAVARYAALLCRCRDDDTVFMQWAACGENILRRSDDPPLRDFCPGAATTRDSDADTAGADCFCTPPDTQRRDNDVHPEPA